MQVLPVIMAGGSGARAVALELVEVQVGPHLGEDDIVRLEDRYGRA